MVRVHVRPPLSICRAGVPPRAARLFGNGRERRPATAPRGGDSPASRQARDLRAPGGIARREGRGARNSFLLRKNRRGVPPRRPRAASARGSFFRQEAGGAPLDGARRSASARRFPDVISGVQTARARGGCLGDGRRRRTRQAAKSSGEAHAALDPEVSEWGNPSPARGTPPPEEVGRRAPDPAK